MLSFWSQPCIQLLGVVVVQAEVSSSGVVGDDKTRNQRPLACLAFCQVIARDLYLDLNFSGISDPQQGTVDSIRDISRFSAKETLHF